jgi:hypothetical protein
MFSSSFGSIFLAQTDSVSLQNNRATWSSPSIFQALTLYHLAARSSRPVIAVFFSLTSSSRALLDVVRSVCRLLRFIDSVENDLDPWENEQGWAETVNPREMAGPDLTSATRTMAELESFQVREVGPSLPRSFPVRGDKAISETRKSVHPCKFPSVLIR